MRSMCLHAKAFDGNPEASVVAVADPAGFREPALKSGS